MEKTKTNKPRVTNTSLPSAFMAEKCLAFGYNMRTMRKERGISTESMSKFLDLSATYVGLLERGERCPSLEVFLSVCDFFGASVDSMVTPPAQGMMLKEKHLENKNLNEAINAKVQTISGMARTFGQNELDLVISMMQMLKSYSTKTDGKDKDAADGVSDI